MKKERRNNFVFIISFNALTNYINIKHCLINNDI